jgi:hypothetical protein
VNKDATDAYKSLWGSAMDKFNDVLVKGLVEGKFELGDFVTYVLEELLRIQMAKQMAKLGEQIGGGDGAGGILGGLFSGVGKLFGGGSSAPASAGSTQAGYTGAFGFADGGIMTEYGALALNKYANGGIAKEPQVAIYGEGSMAEAYVPLPDGRSIPVTMNMPAAAQQQANNGGGINQEINIINQSGEQVTAESSTSFNGEKYVTDIILKGVNRPGPLRDAISGVK